MQDPYYVGPDREIPDPLRDASLFPGIIHGERIQTELVALPMDIICGMLARGEKGSLNGGSKSFKTWALIGQALSVACGIDWWGFKSTVNHVLFLNLEIPRAYCEERVRCVAAALGIKKIPETFHVWHLRDAKLGSADRWTKFLGVLKAACADIPNPYLISDPIYKLLGGRNENAAGDVQLLLGQLDDMITAVDGANFFGHHYTKGNQAAKEAIDRAAGSGVFQRDPDSILTMTAHEKDACFTIDAILRNHPPINPFVVEWRYPLFERVSDIDPADLKPAKRVQQRKYSVQQLLDKLGDDCLKAGQFRQRVMDETGMSRPTFFNLFDDAKTKNLIIYDGQSKTWERNGNSRNGLSV